jgi:hypothetical protein
MIRFAALQQGVWGVFQRCNDRLIQPCLQSNLALRIGDVARSILESRIGSFSATCWKHKTALLAAGSTISLSVVWVLYRRAQAKEAASEVSSYKRVRSQYLLQCRARYLELSQELLNESQQRLEALFGTDPSSMPPEIAGVSSEIQTWRDQISAAQEALIDPEQPIQRLYYEGPQEDGDEELGCFANGGESSASSEEETEEVNGERSIESMFGEERSSWQLLADVLSLHKRVSRLIEKSLQKTQKRLDGVLACTRLIVQMNGWMGDPFSCKPWDISSIEKALGSIFEELQPQRRPSVPRGDEEDDGVRLEKSPSPWPDLPSRGQPSQEASLRSERGAFSTETLSMCEQLYHFALDLLETLKSKRRAALCALENHSPT